MNNNFKHTAALLVATVLCFACALPAVAGPHGHHPGPGPRRAPIHHLPPPAPHHPHHAGHHYGPSRGWYNAALIVDATLGVLDIATRACEPAPVIYQQTTPQTVVYQQPAPQTVVYQQPAPAPQTQTVIYQPAPQPQTQTVIYQPTPTTTTTTTYAPNGVTYQTVTQ